MCVANTQINRIYQRKHEILKIWEGGAMVFCLRHSNPDFVHLIQQAEFFKKKMLLMAALNTNISFFSIYVKMKLKPQQIRNLCLFVVVITIILKQIYMVCYFPLSCSLMFLFVTAQYFLHAF